MKRKTIPAIMSLLLAAAVLTACGNAASEISTEEDNALVSASGKVMDENPVEEIINTGKEAFTAKEVESNEQKAAENTKEADEQITAGAAVMEVTAETTKEAPVQTASANKTNTENQKTAAVSTNNATAAETQNGEWWRRLDTTDAAVDRTRGEEVFALLNAERALAGLNELVWDEELYDIAVQRCYENDGHDGARANTGENAGWWQGMSSTTTAQTCHDTWYNSTGHHDNYMAAFYTKGAVAFIKTKNGAIIGYEVFAGDSYGKNNSTAAANGMGITVTQGTLLSYHRHSTDPYDEGCPLCNPKEEPETTQKEPVDTTSEEYLLSDTAVFAGSAEEVQAMHDEMERLQAEEMERIRQEAEAEVRRMEQELGIKILDY